MAFDEMLSEHQVYLFERNGFVNAGPLISEAEADQLANEILTIIERREDSNFPQPLRIANLSRSREANLANRQYLAGIRSVFSTFEEYEAQTLHFEVDREIRFQDLA